MDRKKMMRRAVEVFGASQATDAVVAIDAYHEAWGMPLGTPYPDQSSDEAKAILDRMRLVLDEYGYESATRFDLCIRRWIRVQQGNEIAPIRVERSSYAPIDLGSAYHDGCLYYPVQTLLRTSIGRLGESARGAERIDVVVVRSDRTLQRIEESLDENGKASGIYRLSDGTLLQKKPSASAHSTWAWHSIEQYLNRDYMPRPLSILAAKIHRHLRSRVWLATEADYWLLVFAAITSFVQPVFDAVPLILLHGDPGTGKSELGAAITEVSCNAVMIGQTSAPSMLRLMDETRGLVVIDDLESIGIKGGAGGREKFSEMVQVLKVSYKKASATKIITNTRREIEVMNFYGVKIVSNTKGVDAILGSRMLHISTSKIGPDDLDEFLSRAALSLSDLQELKNDLHMWAFDNAKEVGAIYQEIVAGSTARDEEIMAPIKVLARMANIPGVLDSIEASQQMQRAKKLTYKSPEHAIDHIVEKLAAEGRRTFTLIELSLRLRGTLGIGGFTGKIKPLWAKPEWISKWLRSSGWMGEELKRKNQFGYQMKVFTLSDEMRIRRGLVGVPKGGPFDFCAGCVGCPYRNLKCDILPYRAAREGL